MAFLIGLAWILLLYIHGGGFFAQTRLHQGVIQTHIRHSSEHNKCADSSAYKTVSGSNSMSFRPGIDSFCLRQALGSGIVAYRVHTVCSCMVIRTREGLNSWCFNPDEKASSADWMAWFRTGSVCYRMNCDIKVIISGQPDLVRMIFKCARMLK